MKVHTFTYTVNTPEFEAAFTSNDEDVVRRSAMEFLRGHLKSLGFHSRDIPSLRNLENKTVVEINKFLHEELEVSTYVTRTFIVKTGEAPSYVT